MSRKSVAFVLAAFSPPSPCPPAPLASSQLRPGGGADPAQLARARPQLGGKVAGEPFSCIPSTSSSTSRRSAFPTVLLYRFRASGVQERPAQFAAPALPATVIHGRPPAPVVDLRRRFLPSGRPLERHPRSDLRVGRIRPLSQTGGGRWLNQRVSRRRGPVCAELFGSHPRRFKTRPCTTPQSCRHTPRAAYAGGSSSTASSVHSRSRRLSSAKSNLRTFSITDSWPLTRSTAARIAARNFSCSRSRLCAFGAPRLGPIGHPPERGGGPSAGWWRGSHLSDTEWQDAAPPPLRGSPPVPGRTCPIHSPHLVGIDLVQHMPPYL